jgi:hypothetical protein
VASASTLLHLKVSAFSSTGELVWNDSRPEAELNFKFYRQTTNKIVSISDRTAAFIEGFF